MDISPDKQNIDRVFSNTTYYIDFYQRDYKWNDEPVSRLLSDIFYSFEESYSKHKALAPGIDTIMARYPWYYLNTYVTNNINGKIYIVDGQQRLTTITIILLGLFHISRKFDSKLSDWIKSKIIGQHGFSKNFWMNHERHLPTLMAILESADDIPDNTGITAINIASNYRYCYRYLENSLQTKHKLETFVFFFLNRLVLINLTVAMTDVPMVFEVINDRGVRLRPYEILKGKLLGQIDKIELENRNFNELWDQCVSKVNSFKFEEIDNFFVYFLKSKFSDTRGKAERFDKDYHREIFKEDMNNVLHLDHDAAAVKTFLEKDFRYFTSLYVKIWQLSTTKGNIEHVFFNRLNGMDAQNLLILSACVVDDPEESEKIRLISFQLDRLFTLLRLQRAYDSNEFADEMYDISCSIREKDADSIVSVFEKKLLDILSNRKSITVENQFDYSQFKNTSVNDLPSRFARYFFARVDNFLARETNVGEKHPIEDLVTKTGNKNGFHVEHILSNNSDNTGLYDNDEEFEIDRNRLGAVLLLKGLDNISSSNESYSEKLKTYAGTLYWNETLREDAYKSKMDFKSMIEKNGLSFCAFSSFGPSEVESRQRLLFDISNIIWHN